MNESKLLSDALHETFNKLIANCHHKNEKNTGQSLCDAQSTTQSTNLSVTHIADLRADQSTNLSVTHIADLRADQSTTQSATQSTNQSTPQSTTQSTNQSTTQSTSLNITQSAGPSIELYKPLKCKTSYGIICYNKGRILLVKKPVTYHFCEFMTGHYNADDHNYLKFLFSNMTYHEKRHILSMPFEYLWRYIYNMPLNQTYIRKKTKFDTLNKQLLAKLIAGTHNVDLMWEAPKGRKNPDETDIAAAVRELHEETNMSMQDYDIKWDWPPLVERFEDLGVIYQNVYWLAESSCINYRVNTYEIADCAWLTLADIMTFNMNADSHARLVVLMKTVHKRFKTRKLKYFL